MNSIKINEDVFSLLLLLIGLFAARPGLNWILIDFTTSSLDRITSKKR